MLIVRRLQRRNGIFNQRRVSLAKLALPYAIESVAFSDKNQSTICLFQIMSKVQRWDTSKNAPTSSSQIWVNTAVIVTMN